VDGTRFRKPIGLAIAAGRRDQARIKIGSDSRPPARRRCRHSGPRGLPLPSFASMAVEVRRQLVEGRGFVVLRGLDLDNYSESAALLLYGRLGTHVGASIPQNLRGERFYSVRDEGIRMEAEYGRSGLRYSKTNSAFDSHTDSPSRASGRTPDFIALLVLRTAKSGGDSALVSGDGGADLQQGTRQAHDDHGVVWVGKGGEKEEAQCRPAIRDARECSARTHNGPAARGNWQEISPRKGIRIRPRTAVSRLGWRCRWELRGAPATGRLQPGDAKSEAVKVAKPLKAQSPGAPRAQVYSPERAFH